MCKIVITDTLFYFLAAWIKLTIKLKVSQASFSVFAPNKCIILLIWKYCSQQNWVIFFTTFHTSCNSIKNYKNSLLSFSENSVSKSKHPIHLSFVIVERVDRGCLNLVRAMNWKIRQNKQVCLNSKFCFCSLNMEVWKSDWKYLSFWEIQNTRKIHFKIQCSNAFVLSS